MLSIYHLPHFFYFPRQDSPQCFISPSNLLCKKDAILPNWIRLPKQQDIMYQKIQKVLYFGFPIQCFSCKKIGHLAKDCLPAHVKPIAATKTQSNSVVTTLLPHEIQQVKAFDRSSDKVGKGKSVDMLCSNIP